MRKNMLTAEGVKVYPYRWVVLVVYLLIVAVIQLLWATFFSVATSSWQHFGFTDAVQGEGAINLLSIIFMAGMIVLSIPSLAAFEKWGFKKSVGLGALLMGVFALLRGFFGNSYPMVLIATVGFAVAQPFIVNAPGLVAGKWFPENERATANGVGLLANYLGIAAGLLLTPTLLEGGASIRHILIIYGIIAAAASVLFLVFSREKPPTPPCPEEDAFRMDFREGLKTAMKKKNYIFSVILFFCLLGIFNTFFTMIEPLMSAMTDVALSATQAGIVGVVVLLTGIVGSAIVSLLSDKDKRRRRLLYIIVCNAAGFVGFLLFMLLNSFPGMLAAAAVYGLCTVGSAPVVLTFAAETAYPTSEGTSEGLLLFSGNVGGVVFLGLASLFAGQHLGIMVAMSAVSLACVLLMLFAKETKLQRWK